VKHARIVAALLGCTHALAAKPVQPPKKPSKPAPEAAAQPAKTAPTAVTGLDRGLELLQDDEPEEAAAVFVAASRASQVGDGRHERIEFHLARALRALDLHQAAVELLAAVLKNRTVPELVPQALGLLLAEVDSGKADIDFVETVLVDLDVGTLAGEHSDAVVYYQGTADLRQGRLKWAEASFRAIKIPRYRHRADLALGAYHLARGDVETARQAFARVAEAGDAPESVKELARVSLARVLRDADLATKDTDGKETQKRLQQSRELYAQLHGSVGVTADVLLERAWLEFEAGDARRALGFLLALDGPQFRHRVLPDKYLLRSLIYSEACHYGPARHAARGLERDFPAVLDAIKDRRSPQEDAALREALAVEPTVAPLDRLRRDLAHETAIVRDLDDDKLRAWLTTLYSDLKSDNQRRLQLAREAAIADLGGKLLDSVADLRVVEFELALKLHRRIRGETVARSGRLGAAPKIPYGSERAFFPFDGEYWGDETADLVVYLEDLCVE
jgi:tetratricopeptide (TPR) repeat protein